MRAYYALMLLFFLPGMHAQVNVIDSVLYHYNTTSISFEFEQQFYSSTGSSFKRNGEISIYRKDTLIQCRVLEKNAQDYISSAAYAGYNNLLDRTFINYMENNKGLLDEMTDFAFYIFYPKELRFLATNPLRFKSIITESKDNYFISIQYLHPEQTSDSLALVNSLIEKFTISKKNYRITAYSSVMEISFNGVVSIDSTKAVYRYKNVNSKQVLKEIQQFIPFIKSKNYNDRLSTPIDTVTRFPSYQLTDTAKNKYDSERCKAKYVLIEFWYKNCGPCLANIKELKKVRNAFAKEDVEILAINDIDPFSRDLVTFLKKYDVNYTVLFGAEGLRKKLNITNHPSTYIYDNKTKKVILHKTGGGPGYAHEISDFLHGTLGD